MNSNHDLDRCDYDTAAITDYDPRFEASKKSALFLHILGIVASIIGTCWMFYFGTGDPTDDILCGVSSLVFRCDNDLHHQDHHWHRSYL